MAARPRTADSDEYSNQDVMRDDLLAEDDDNDALPTPPYRASTRSRRPPAPEYVAPAQEYRAPVREYRPPAPEYRAAAPEYRAAAPESVSQPRAANDGGLLRLIIAIDYGTTFTGVAFATPNSDRVKLSDIDLVDDWGENMGLTSKVPSVFSYSPPTNAGEQQWGSSLSPKAVTMVNTKLELDVQENKLDELELILQVLDGTNNLGFDGIKKSKGYPEYTWKSPEEVVTDYLSKIFQYLNQNFEVFGERLRSNIPVDIVVTVPVKWSYRAKNSTLRAIKKAGFNEETFPNLNRMILVTEPEAAAIYTARSLKEDRRTEFLKRDEIFVLCDAGGGTVDCVAYQVVQLEPTLELKEVSIATSDRCGSSYIDKAFKRWLRKRIGDVNFRELLGRRLAGQQISSNTLEGEHMRNLIKAFEVHKKKYPTQTSAMNLDLPGPLQHLNIPGVVNEGKLTLTDEDMASIFKNCVDRTIELILGQIAQVERKKCRVKNVFLVGGFGESPFLQQELEESLVLRKITMRQPDKKSSWTAVVQGAVIYGVERHDHGKLSLMSTCSRSYAIVLNETNSVHHFDPRDRYTDTITNRVTAQKQLTWLVRRGDLILSDEKRTSEKEFTVLFLENGVRRFNLPIYMYSDDDELPDRFETAQNELEPVAVVDFDLSRYPLSDFVQYHNPKTGAPYYVAYLTCKTVLCAKSFDIDIFWKDTRIGDTSIKDMEFTSGYGFDDDALSDY